MTIISIHRKYSINSQITIILVNIVTELGQRHRYRLYDFERNVSVEVTSIKRAVARVIVSCLGPIAEITGVALPLIH